jgi:hypothetical protein
MQNAKNIIKAQDVDIIFKTTTMTSPITKTSNGSGNSIKAASHFRLQGG